MATTYEPIATSTLGSSAASFTFTSIPSTYTDLVIVAVGNVSANSYMKLIFNGVTSSIYSQTLMYGTGSTAGAGRQPTSSGLGYFQSHYLYTGSSQAPMKVQIMNYANTSIYKSCIMREDDATYELTARFGLFQSTNAITSVTLERISGTWNTGATFTLYGIKAA